MKSIHHLLNQFNIKSDVVHASELNSGFINDTYLVTTRSGSQYVLQRINSVVFKDVENVIANKVLISEHLHNSNSKYQTVRFIKTYEGVPFLKDKNSDYWNLMTFVSDSVTHEVATNSQLVEEAGKLYGDFMIQTANLDMDKLVETLPEFHSIPLRYKQFDEASKNATEEIKENAKDEIVFVLKCRDEMHELSILKDNNAFPIRVTHNDAKLSNILFDIKDKGVAVIDLDTVMPGIVAFDFGDSIRSICTTTTEDDTNLYATKINLIFYEAFCKGFASTTKHILTPLEIKYLPLGAKTITFIMGLRFLTDYLNGNIYYKVDYETHNLVRAKNQFKLVKSIQENYQTMQQITDKIFK
ncbi:MAG: phosphotransferase [Bacteroidia bacterium]|nr:phosphotransferase [Bacteroidia bacterium]